MKDSELIKDLILKYDNSYFNTTGTILNLMPNSLYFIKSIKYLYHLNDTINIKNLNVIMPNNKKIKEHVERFSHINFYFADDVSYVFGEVHNYIHQGRGFYIENQIHPSVQIHPTASLDTEGIHLYHTPQGKKQLKHLSNVEIFEETTIGANTVIHRGVFNPTTIMNNVIIGSLVNIAHNCFIDSDTVITPGCILAGRVSIGKNCWVGINSSFKHGVEICNNVIIGQHSNVRHNITEPGIYAGEPLRKINEYTEGWNF